MTLGAPMENGWPECDLSDCDYATVPGTPLRLPFRKGIPFIILQAFLRDLNEFIEPLMNLKGALDEGSWTEDNSVYTSNHKGATAFDYNWSDHPMGNADAGWNGSVLIDGNQVPAVRDLLRFYSFKGIQLVWWGNDWSSPKDSMHFQMGYSTASNPEICNEFISKFIRPDGFSTYRRGATGTTPPAGVTTVPLTQRPDGTWTSPSPAWAHLIQRESSGNPTIIQQIIDVNSGGNEAEGLFQITPKTWKANGGEEFAPSARLATPQQQAIVAARIFTRNPSGSDWGAGLPGREDAKQLAAGLVPLADTPDQGDEDDMASGWTPELVARAMVLLENQTGVFRKSASPLRHWGEKEVNTCGGFARTADGLTHPQFVLMAARFGHLDSIDLIAEVANGDLSVEPDRAEDKKLANAMLQDLQDNYPAALQAYIDAKGHAA